MFYHKRLSFRLAVLVKVGTSPLMSMIQASPLLARARTLFCSYMIAGLAQDISNGTVPTTLIWPSPEGSISITFPGWTAVDVASKILILPSASSHARGYKLSFLMTSLLAPSKVRQPLKGV